MSVTFGLAKSRHFYHILLYMSMCIFVYIFYINNTAKGNTSLMLNKLLLLYYLLYIIIILSLDFHIYSYSNNMKAKFIHNLY